MPTSAIRPPTRPGDVSRGAPGTAAIGGELGAAPPARFDIVGLGEISVDDVLLVDEAPRWGSKVRVRRREQVGGGQVATAMVAAQRLGRSTALIGVVGDDAPGLEALRQLAAEHVDVSGVLRIAGGTTHQAVILVGADAERTVLWSETEHAGFSESDLVAERVTEGRVLHVDGNFLGAAIPAAALARGAGRLVSCDLDRYETRTPQLLAFVDVCVVSSEFMRAFAGASDRDSALAALPRLGALLPRGAVACVTLGSDGAAAWDGCDVVAAPAFAPLVVVDTTACGDTFRAAFLCARLDGKSLPACLREANAAAALKMRDLGRRGCPTAAELRAFLASRPEAPSEASPPGPSAR